MLNFYLGAKDSSHIIHVETNATYISQIATFDNGSFNMEWNETEHAIAPQTKILY